MRFARAIPILLAAAGLTGCGPRGSEPATPAGAGPRLKAWVVNEMVNLTGRATPVDDPLIYQPGSNTVELFSAMNETVGFQLVVEAREGDLAGLNVDLTDLRDRDGRVLDANVASVFRMTPVPVREFPAWTVRLAETPPRPGRVYDALVPVTAARGGQPYDLARGQRAVFWIDLAVPRRVAAGVYTGKLVASAEGAESFTANIELKVYDFVLPDTRALVAIGGFDHAELMAGLLRRDGLPFRPVRADRGDPLFRRGLAAMREMMRTARAHGLDLFEKTLRPHLGRDSAGEVQLDWSDYDAVVRPYLGGSAYRDRLGNPAWASPISGDWPRPASYGGTGSARYRQTLTDAARQVRDHFKQIGHDNVLFTWTDRRPVGPDVYTRDVVLRGWLEEADPRTPLLVRAPPDPPAGAGWRVPEDFFKLADMFAPPGEWFDPTAAAAAAAPSPLVGPWLCPGTPPYAPSLSVIASGVDARALAWLGMKYRPRGLFLPEVLNWAGHDDLLHISAGAEDRLFYPGRPAGVDGVLPSVRLKRLRRGLQDAQYLSLLRGRGQGELADELISAMVHYAGTAAAGDHYLDPRLGGWHRDPAGWQLARKLMAEQIQLAIYGDQIDPSALEAQRVAWRRLNLRTRRVRVERVRTRIEPRGEGMAGGATVTLTAELWNQHAQAAEATLAAASVPPGWQAVVQRAASGRMPSGGRSTVQLQFTAEGMPVDNTGHVPLELVLTDPHRQPLRWTHAVPFVIAAPAQKPITIDGSLRDWPMLPGIAAGAFRLLGRRGTGDDPLAGRQTTVFCLHDQKNLYIAARCNEPRPDRLVYRRDNRVQTEQLLAVGEDLLEVLLDPGGRARSAEELYHLVVKPGGAVRTERGVRTTPPLGTVRPWGAGVSVAVAKEARAWVVELSIPLASFGAAAGEPLWRANFMRYTPAGFESSSWSGARRYYYSPQNLGTMWLPSAAETPDTPEGASRGK